MKINPYIQVQQVYNTKKAGCAKKAEAAGRKDDVVISDFGKEIQTAKQAVANAPDIRAEITEPLRAAVKNGTYEVSGGTFAEKLLAAAGKI
ncbi:MAG: flagellar biosynthesis anti-sigma factor FlgM [Lachnospiraceae bacterium]|jgi:negative regulator of flagellin synthesis FlgM|nr:flagellar biosynthesis anti-sigma factor FlgM [Lachnospiraceae bacterium]